MTARAKMVKGIAGGGQAISSASVSMKRPMAALRAVMLRYSPLNGVVWLCIERIEGAAGHLVDGLRKAAWQPSGCNRHRR